MKRKILLMPLAAHHPHPRLPSSPGLGTFLSLHPSRPPTYLFPFLDFIFHGEASPPLLPPSWPPPPSSPTQFFVLFPAWSETPPARSSCPSHLIVSRGLGVGGGGWRTQPWNPPAGERTPGQRGWPEDEASRLQLKGLLSKGLASSVRLGTSSLNLEAENHRFLPYYYH